MVGSLCGDHLRRIRISSKIAIYILEEIQLDDEQEDYASIKP